MDAGELSDSVERVASLEEHASVSVDTSVRLDVLPEEVDEVPSPPRPPTAVRESQVFSPERRFIRSVVNCWVGCGYVVRGGWLMRACVCVCVCERVSE